MSDFVWGLIVGTWVMFCGYVFGQMDFFGDSIRRWVRK